MRSRLGMALFFVAGVLVATPLLAQVNLSVNKSGNDVVLAWSGGSGTYDIIRSSAYRMSANTSLLQAATTTTGLTDTGALVLDHNPPLYCYVIADVTAKPAVNISSPCDTPPGGPLCTASTTGRFANVSGTTNSTTPVYVSDLQAVTTAGTFAANGVPLVLGTSVVTAATRSANGDWAIDQIRINRQDGNLPPTITVTSPADASTIYDATPFIQIDYADPEGFLNTSDLRVYLDGTDRTSSFSVGPAQATYQLQPSEALAAGEHFIYATIRDTSPYGASATSHFVLSNPVISSFSPAAEGAIGSSITINGVGFDPTPANDSVTFNGVAATVTSATTATLTVTVPAGAQTGPVVVTVDSRSSKGKTFRVLLATGFLSISSVAVDPLASNHVFFTDRSTNDALYEVMPNGSVVGRCTLNEATGLPVDSSGNLYFGIALAGGTSGEVDRFLPASTTCQTFVATTKVIGETNASVFGAALTEVGGLNFYSADNENGRIKRTDPSLAVSRLTSEPLIFSNPTGMAINSAGSTVYFSSTNAIRSLPIPGGAATSTLVRNLVGAPKGMAITGDNKLILTRSSASTNAVSWFDPASSTNPFWDLATGFPSPPVLQSVALGSDGGGPFVVVAETSRVYRIPTPSIVLTNETDALLPTKVVADFAPGTTDCLGANFITLKAKFNPTTLIPDTTPKQLVTWTVEDPDDPSSDLAVDPNDTGGPTPNDNAQVLGSYNQWEAVLGYALTGAPTATSVQTEIVGGVSEVKFHLSCQPGDNYRFVAQVTAPVYGAIQEQTDILTVWRKLHLESDSMGPPAGPFEPDDAVVDDIPVAIYTYFANAFRPAYVEVALPPDTGQDTPDVRFLYHVDTTSSVAIANQGRVGRATTSTAGYWVAYVQAGYEPNEAFDNDPDTELPVAQAGTTNKPRGRYSFTFLETIRDVTNVLGADTEYVNSTIALHEVGHQFQLAEASGCVMDGFPELISVFCGSQLHTIRTRPQPSDQDSP